MTTFKHAPGYVPNPDYSQADWDEVSDTPELTDTKIAELQPNGEGLPVELADAFKRLAVIRKLLADRFGSATRILPI